MVINVALRDQPYLPLYVQDFMTDENLAECSAAANGVFIRTMCLMHKSENYGIILLKQKDKQCDDQTMNFAIKLNMHLPYERGIIYDALNELIEQKVLRIDGDQLIQKRMVKDSILSQKRSVSGKKGAQKKSSKGNDFALANEKAKYKQNTENEIEDENEYEIDINIYSFIEKYLCRTLSPIDYEVIDLWKKDYDEEKIRLAIKETALNRTTNLKYTQAILENWKNKTIDEIKNSKNRLSKNSSTLATVERLKEAGELK